MLDVVIGWGGGRERQMFHDEIVNLSVGLRAEA